MAHIAKVFQSGNSQAVRLPKDFRLDVSEVEITREGDALTLAPGELRGVGVGALRDAE